MEHVAGELFARRAGITMLHVPYKGTGPAMIDLMGGRIQVYLVSAAAVVSNSTNPRIRALMVASKGRNPALPDVPTAEEAGMANFDQPRLWRVGPIWHAREHREETQREPG